MKRRNFLQATGLAWLGTAPDTAKSTGRPVAAPDGPREEGGRTTPDPTRERVDPPAPARWFLDWLPPALTTGSEGYLFGTSPVEPSIAGSSPATETPLALHMLASHARLGVTVGVDPDEKRERLDRGGYERIHDASDHDLYGRSVGRRYQGVALADDALVTARGPAPRPALGWADTLATTDGIALHDEGVLEELLGHLHTSGYLSADIDPASGVAGAGESLHLAPKRSTLRTAVLPSSSGRRQDAKEYLTDLARANGVVSVSTEWRDGALVREARVRTEELWRGLGGSHGG